jgi:hypothetical protein
LSEPALAAWKLPPIVAAIAVSIVGGFYLGGPGLGMAVGALAATAIVVMAVRHPPVYPIAPPAAGDSRRHILVLLSSSLGEGEALQALLHTASATVEDRYEPEILVVAPSRHRFLDRWMSDAGPGRERAQQRLVLSLASLAKAGIEASARVGDEDVVQMAEDELRSFPATEVVLVTGAAGRDAAGDAAAAALESRLETPFRRLCIGGQCRCHSMASRTQPGWSSRVTTYSGSPLPKSPTLSTRLNDSSRRIQ